MIKIRKATLKDVPVLVELWKEFEDEHDKKVIKKNPVMKPLFKYKPDVMVICRKSLRKTISKIGFVFIAEENKKAVGFLEGTIKKPELTSNRIGFISEIFVTRKYRGMGISSKLKDKAIYFFKKNGVKFGEIHVNVHNREAHNIYRKWGFFEDGIRLLKKL